MKENAVLFHIYYEDAYQVVQPFLEKVQDQADLIFNFVEGKANFLDRVKADFPQAVILFSKNPGRDIRGYLNCLSYVYESQKNYRNYFFVHTKTQKDSFGKRSLSFLVNSTLGSMKAALAELEKPEVGMVGSGDFIYTGFYDKDTAAKSVILCERLEIDLPPWNFVSSQPSINYWEPSFVAGTMFAVKAEVIDFYLRKPGLVEEICQDFVEDGRSYGGWHHAWERIFGLMVYARNMRISPL
jgi:lipopolysaccharide biosynthesis protein